MIIINEWIRNIFMIAVSISFIEIILPAGRMTKYLKFIFSTIMIVVIIQPIAYFSGTDGQYITAFRQGSLYPEANETELTEKYTFYTIDMDSIYKSKIIEKTNEVLSENFHDVKIKSVQVSMDERSLKSGGGGVHSIQIIVSNGADVKQIRQKVSDEIGLEKSRIIVKKEI